MYKTQHSQFKSVFIAGGAGYIGSSLVPDLLKKNYNVQILDAEAENLSCDQTAEKILSINPKLAVFMIYGQQPSASTQCMPGGKKTCLKLNELSSNAIKSIVVGTHASALPKKTLNELFEEYDITKEYLLNLNFKK